MMTIMRAFFFLMLCSCIVPKPAQVDCVCTPMNCSEEAQKKAEEEAAARLKKLEEEVKPTCYVHDTGRDIPYHLVNRDTTTSSVDMSEWVWDETRNKIDSQALKIQTMFNCLAANGIETELEHTVP